MIIDDYKAIASQAQALKDAGTDYCPTCENGGWVQIHSERPPAFAECPDCYNPMDLPSP